MTIDRIDLVSRRVLIAEDNLFIAVNLTRLLRTKGVEIVGPVGTVQEALELVRRKRIDAAVLDINLRGEMVYPVADAARATGARVVFMTGYDESLVKQGYADISCLQKPVSVERLIEALFG